MGKEIYCSKAGCSEYMEEKNREKESVGGCKKMRKESNGAAGAWGIPRVVGAW